MFTVANFVIVKINKNVTNKKPIYEGQLDTLSMIQLDPVGLLLKSRAVLLMWNYNRD